jgi:phosphatidylserine decarboxylase
MPSGASLVSISPVRPDVSLSGATIATAIILALAFVVSFTRWGWRFAPEGLPFIAIALVVLAVFIALLATRPALGWLVATGLWGLVSLWVCSFFRDPRPSGPLGDQFVLSPAQGHVVAVVDMDEPGYLREPATRVSIFLSVFDVHVNRYPVNGTVEVVRYNPGKFMHAGKDKASLDNEQAAIGIRGPRGQLLVRQIAGSVARRIVTDARAGDSARQGERLGMIRFGSRVDLFLPKSAGAKLKVQVGDKVVVGTTVLAEYGL